MLIVTELAHVNVRKVLIMFDVTWIWQYPPISAKEAVTESTSTYEDDVFWQVIITRPIDEGHEVGIKQIISNRFINQRGIWYILNTRCIREERKEK